KSAVSRVLSGKPTTTPKKKPGSPSKLDERTKRRIVRYMQANIGVTAPSVVASLQLGVSPQTLRRFLNAEGASYASLKTSPPLSDAHKASRVRFAKYHLDNHTDFSTTEWFQGQGVTTTEWPSLSPDLNPIENIWAYLVKQVYGPDKPNITCKAQLRSRLWHAWETMPKAVIGNCVGSMTRRLTQ
ncbi:hypothetical protein FOL47_003865, partial [Perkinsus chesapeaki]